MTYVGPTMRLIAFFLKVKPPSIRNLKDLEDGVCVPSSASFAQANTALLKPITSLWSSWSMIVALFSSSSAKESRSSVSCKNLPTRSKDTLAEDDKVIRGRPVVLD